MTDVSGFAELSSVGGTLQIGGAADLSSSIPTVVDTGGNQTLGDITGFGSLTSIGDHLLILDNNSLSEISGFDSRTDLQIGGDFQVRHNDTLPTDRATTLADATASIGGNRVIQDNDS